MSESNRVRYLGFTGAFMRQMSWWLTRKPHHPLSAAMAPQNDAPQNTPSKQPNPEKTVPVSLVVPSSSGQIWNGALSTEKTATAPKQQQEARMPIDASHVAGEDKRKGISGWSIEDVTRWLKDEGFEQNICGKFIGAPFSQSSRILHLHIEQRMTSMAMY